MKNFTRILISTSLTLMMAINAHSQDVFKTANVGVGVINPAQKLDVAGNIKFSGALMPNGNAGIAGNILLSGGPSPLGNVFPTWLANGTSGQVLEITGGVPTWTTLSLTAGWALTGNSGTIPGTNFIGTTDDDGLYFEVNGAYAGGISALNNNYTAANVYLGGASTSAPILNGAGNKDAGDNSVGIGLSALASVGGGSWQGYGADNTGTSVMSGNVAVGVYALSSAVYGGGSTAIGAWSQRYLNIATSNTTAGNTSAGAYSLYSNSTGTYNTSVGYKSMYGIGSATAVGNFNSALGYQSLYTAGAGTYSNTAIGSNSLVSTASGNRNTAVGDSALATNTTGFYNTALGYQSDVSANNLSNATAIGYKALALVSNSVTIGSSSAVALYLPGYAAVGDILYTSAGTGLVGALTPGASGTVLESQGPGLAPTWASVAGINSVTGTPPIYSTGGSTPVISIQGNSPNTDAGGVLYSTGAGTSAVFTSTGTANYVLQSNGTAAPTWVSAPAAANAWLLTGNTLSPTTYGANYLGTLNTATQVPLEFKVSNAYAGLLDANASNIYFGQGTGGDSTVLNIVAAQNVAIGWEAFAKLPGTTAASDVAAIGADALHNNTVSNNDAVGAFALYSNTTGTPNTAFGYAAGYNITTGSNNFTAGYNSMYYQTTGTFNVAVGDSAMYGAKSGVAGASYVSTANTAMGVNALGALAGTATTGSYNTAVGYESSRNVTTGTYNSSVGYQSGYTNTAGYGNVALGYNSLFKNTSSDNVAIGTNASLNTIGAGNIAVGDSALYSNTTGTNNIAIGYQANVSSPGLTNATSIGYQAVGVASNSVTLGNSSAQLYLPGYTNVGDILYTSAGNGLVSALVPGASGTILESLGSGVAPTWVSVAGANSLSGTVPIYITGTATAPVVNIQGLNSNQGGILYSAGTGNSAAFTAAGTTGQVLQSNGTSAPTWVTPTAASGWALTGNSIASTNFLGTTDAQPLVFEVNGKQGGRIDINYQANASSNVYLGSYGTYNSVNYNSPGGLTGDAGTVNVGVGVAALGGYNAGGNSGNGAVGCCGANVAIGAFAFPTSTNGDFDVAIGAYSELNAAYTSASTGNSIGIGAYTLYSNTTGPNETAIGYQSMYGTGSGTAFGPYNTAVGYNSLYSISGGTSNTALGSNALYNDAGVGSVGGNRNTAAGDSALATNTSGEGNTAIGYQADVASGSLTNATAIGYQAVAPVSNSITLGNTSVTALYLPGYTNVGNILYTSATPSGLVSGLTPGVSGLVLTSAGPGAVPTWTSVTGANSVSGTVPIYITGTATAPIVNIQGTAADQGSILYSTGAGTSAAFLASGTTGQVLQSNGTSAPTWVTPTALGVGAWSLTGNANTTSANYLGTTSNTNPLIFKVGGVFSGAIDYTNQCVVLGYGAGSEGGGAAEVGTPIGGSTIIGFEAAYNNTANLNGTVVGSYALYSAVTPTYPTGAMVAVGYSTQYYGNGVGISGSVSVGAYSLYSNAPGANVTGENETAIGYKSMYGSGTSTGYFGNSNTAVGYQALYSPNGGVAFSNTAVGSNALYNNQGGASLAASTGGNRNTAVGDSALVTNTTGSYNTALGYDADVSANNLTNATAIGYQAIAPVSNSVTLGNTSVTSLYLPGYTATGDLLYTSAATGLVSQLVPSVTAGMVLASGGSGVAPTWVSVTGANTVAGAAPIYITGTATAPIVNIQGNSPNTDAGGVLYSTGAGTSALFTPTPASAGLVLTSSAAGAAPTWTIPSITGAWFLTGNSGTAPATNYIGTTDQEPLVFKVNGQYAGIIDENVGNYLQYQSFSTYLGAGGTIPAIYGGQTYGGCGNGDFGTVANSEGNNAAYGLAAMGSVGNYEGQNIAFGAFALASMVTGENQVAIGAFAERWYGVGLSAATNANELVSNGNTAVGAFSMYAPTTGEQNTAIGFQSMMGGGGLTAAIPVGNNNTAIGYNSLYMNGAAAGTIVGSTSNTAVGSNSLYNTVSSNSVIGHGGNMNTAVGDSALASNTSGESNTGVGYDADVASGTLTNATVIGYKASGLVSNSVTLGNTSVNALYLPGYAAVGDLLYTSAATGLVASLAPSATAGMVLASGGSGAAPTWVTVTGANTVTGTAPIYITGTTSSPIVNIQGNSPNTDAGGVLYSTGAGTSATFTPTPTSAGLVLTSGATGAAPTWSAAPAASNSWLITGNAATVAGTNYVGTSSTQALAFKVNSTPAGWLDYAGNLNSYFGYGTGNATGGGDYGNSNVAMGVYAMANVPSGTAVSATEAIGAYAMYNASTGTNDVAFGAYTQYNSTSSFNVSVGAYSLYSNTSGAQEVALGYKSMYGSGTPGVTGINNTAIGYQSLYNITTGGANTAVGSNSLYNSTGGRNTAVGDSALFSNTTGEFNTAVGYGALSNTATTNGNTTGNYNTALGYNANVSSGALTNANAIGAFAYATQSNSMVLGSINGVNGATSNTNVCFGTNAPQSDAAISMKTLHLETQVASTAITEGSLGTGVIAGTPTGTDVGGNFTFTPPANASAGAQVTINFANAYNVAPTVIITSASSNTAAIMGIYKPYVTSTTTGFTLNFGSGGTASNNLLTFNYFVIETQ